MFCAHGHVDKKKKTERNKEERCEIEDCIWKWHCLGRGEGRRDQSKAAAVNRTGRANHRRACNGEQNAKRRIKCRGSKGERERGDIKLREIRQREGGEVKIKTDTH